MQSSEMTDSGVLGFSNGGSVQFGSGWWQTGWRRRSLTRPIWMLERNWPRTAVLKRFRELAPLHQESGSGTVVAVLGTVAQWRESVWAAWSFARQAGTPGFSLRLFLDGDCPDWEGIREGVARVLPDAAVLPVRAWLESRYRSEEEPVLRAFLDHHPMAVKLLLVLSLSAESNVLYFDNDVLFFGSVGELREGTQQSTPRYLRDIGAGSWDPAMKAAIDKRGMRTAEALNGGLHYVPRQSLQTDIARDLLAAVWEPGMRHWHTEQTINSALFGCAGGKCLDPSRYVVSVARQFYFERDVDYRQIACRHFTGPVRHLMYSRGYRRLLADNQANR